MEFWSKFCQLCIGVPKILTVSNSIIEDSTGICAVKISIPSFDSVKNAAVECQVTVRQ